MTIYSPFEPMIPMAGRVLCAPARNCWKDPARAVGNYTPHQVQR